MCQVIVIILLGIWCHTAFAEKNFWGNDICYSDRDCSGLTTCDFTFGCTVSVWKVALVVFGVFVAIVLIIVAVVWLCFRNLWRNRFRRPNNQFVPQTTITTTTTGWNQPQMSAASAVYPTQPYPNQNYPNSVNPPPYSSYVTDVSVGGGAAGMNSHQIPSAPSAPYSPIGYDGHAQESPTYHSKH